MDKERAPQGRGPVRRPPGIPVSGMQLGAVRGAGHQEQAEGPNVDVWDGRLLKQPDLA